MERGENIMKKILESIEQEKAIWKKLINDIHIDRQKEKGFRLYDNCFSTICDRKNNGHRFVGPLHFVKPLKK